MINLYYLDGGESASNDYHRTPLDWFSQPGVKPQRMMICSKGWKGEKFTE